MHNIVNTCYATFLLSYMIVTRAPDKIVIIPMIFKLVIFSLSKSMPNITTKTGSKTDNMDAFSVLRYFNAFNKSKIGRAVQTTAIPRTSIHVLKPLGILKLESAYATIKQVIAHPVDIIKVDIIGEEELSLLASI